MQEHDEAERLREQNEELRSALADCLVLIDDMSRYVGKMSLTDYRLFNDAPMRARNLLT